MSDSKTDNDTPSSGAPRTLTIKRGPGQGTVRQNLSHGRSNAVIVETKKRRIKRPGDSEQVFAPKKESMVTRAAEPVQKEPEQVKPAPVDNTGKKLSANEMDARTRALEEAKVREVIDRQTAQADEKRRAAEDEARKAASEEQKQQQEIDAAKKLEEDAAKKKQEEEAAKMAAADASVAALADDERVVPASKKATPAPTTLREAHRPKTNEAQRPSKPKSGDNKRRTKLTLSNALDDNPQRGRSLAAMRRRREKEKRALNTGPREKIMREVTVPDTITIQELANRMTERSVDVIKYLMQQGQMMTPGDIIDADMAQLIAEEMGHTVVRVSESDVEEGLYDKPDNPEDLLPRPPVVTIMGHVDHGKTSLLDALRGSKVVDGEAGGITQHIGAYQIEKDNNLITFIDTPGHEAFTTMRARGAESTDIAILVVAADDGVMPQTIESINHAKAADVPIIVAINKIDLEGADPTKVRTELLQHEVFVESMGGEVMDVEVSAKEGTNLDGLLDAILLQSEVMELKANPNRAAEGIVVESRLERGRGAVATVLIQRGTLNIGEIIVAGSEWGRVRALINDQGKNVKDGRPSMPVEILGLSGAPSAGDRMVVVENEARAREISEYRQRSARELEIAHAAGSRGSLEQMMTNLQTKGADTAPLVIKGDTQGSVEAIIGSLSQLGNDEVQARVVHSGVGGITEADVTLAMASNTPIIGFNVRANPQARDMAQREGIEIRYYSIIYDLVDDVKDTLSGMLSPERRETFLGNAEILDIFNVSKIGKVAGCLVTEGKVERGAGVRLIRDDVVIHEGELSTLKRFKDEVSEVQSGLECGMAFKAYQDMRKGDVIECFQVEHISRTL